MDNALDPNLMTASERLTEIGEILAAGLSAAAGEGARSRRPPRAFPGLPRQPERPWPETENQEKGHE